MRVQELYVVPLYLNGKTHLQLPRGGGVHLPGFETADLLYRSRSGPQLWADAGLPRRDARFVHAGPQLRRAHLSGLLHGDLGLQD